MRSAEPAGRTLALVLLAAAVGCIGWAANAMILHPKYSAIGNEVQDVERIVRRARQEAPQLFMGPKELAAAAGFALESHGVRTEDGYLLTLHRLLPRAAPAPSDTRPPVLLVHGIFCAADVWLLTPRDQTLAFLLVDNGYDVWLANLRGNPYSRKHERLSSSDLAFWNFSWHEMGVYDLPASVDHVLEATGQRQLLYVGHSMGNTVYYVMCSTRPEYNAKVRLHVGLAPATFMQHMRVLPARLVAPFANEIMRAVEQQRTPEVMPVSAARDAFVYLSCRPDAPSHALCRLFFEASYGPSHPALNESQLGNYISHVLKSSSIRTPAHYAQIIVSGRFCQWDEGSAEGNMQRYGRPTPPDYDLSRVTAPSAIFYSSGDITVHYLDVQRCAREQKQVVLLFLVPERPFNHMDFLYSPTSVRTIYDRIFKLFAQF